MRPWGPGELKEVHREDPVLIEWYLTYYIPGICPKTVTAGLHLRVIRGVYAGGSLEESLESAIHH